MQTRQLRPRCFTPVQGLPGRTFTSLVTALTLAGATLLGGCGSGEDAIDGASAQPNSFPPAKNPVDDFQSGTTGDSSNTIGLAKNEIRVTVEVPGAVAPDGELTRRNLRIVTADRLDVYRTSQSLQPLGAVSVTRRTDDSGREIITFPDGLPVGPDVVVEAVVGNTRMRALAADDDRDVKVNPFSEYLVARSLGSYTSGEFAQVMDCVESTDDNLCLNKYVWSTLADQVHDFEIDIPGTLDLPAAVAFLDQRADFAGYVAAMARYALLGSESSGKITASAADYNTVWAGFELGQTFLDSAFDGAGQWGVRTAQEERLEDDNGVAWVYPGLTLTTFDVIGISITSLASDVPYDRETLAQTTANSFYSLGSDVWDRNSHASAPGAATLADNTRLLAGRALYQSVTGRGSSRIIGWTRNPYYLDAFVASVADGSADSKPDRVLASYFSAGKAIELQAVDGELRRGRLLENQYTGVLEVNLGRAMDFDTASLSGRQYNVVSLSNRMGNSATPVVIESGVGSWQVNGQTVNQALSTLRLLRDSSGAVTGGSGNRDGERLLTARPSVLSSGVRNIGRLSLDITLPSSSTETPELGTGASTPDGSLLAFNLDNTTTGDGLLLAGEQATTAPPVSGRYRLHGVMLGMATGSNRLTQLQGAVLTINSASQATLSWQGVEVVHQVDAGTVSAPTAIIPADLLLGYSSPGNGQVRLNADGLVLEGFVTADQDQFVLRVHKTDGTEQAVGLVLATRLPE